MSNVAVIYTGNDTVLEVANLTNQLTGLPLNAATVTVTLLDSEGEEVDGAVWPLTLAYVTSSRGVYRVTLSYLLDIVAGARYSAEITANGGAGLRAEWVVECVARERG